MLLADPAAKPSPDVPAEAKPTKETPAGKPEAAKPKPGKTEAGKAERTNPKNGKNSAKNQAKNFEMTEEREQAALDFVTQHHPKLVKLIAPLKTSNPREYQRAIRELYRTSERLAGIHQKDPDRYELELDAWKLQSHVRLLAARMTMEDDPEIEQELRAMLKKKAENQLKLLQNERELLESRLQTVQQQIERTSKSQDEFVQQEYDRLLKRTEREKQAFTPRTNSGRPAGKKGANTKASDTTTTTVKPGESK